MHFRMCMAFVMLLFASSYSHGQFGDGYPEGHDNFTSGGWPEPTPDWPAGHDAVDSRTWTHNIRTSETQNHYLNVSSNWPSGHRRYVSSTWPTDTTTTTEPVPRPRPHDVIESKWGLPGGTTTTTTTTFHQTSTSEIIGHVPNHFYNYSKLWGGDHQRSVSIHWPANHIRDRSNNGLPLDPSDHVKDVSNWWDGNGHGSRLSQYWPPGHILTASRTIPSDHDRGMSAAFPPGHYFAVSRDWPGPGTGWPANHYVTTSTDLYGPSDRPWDVFPHDHNWFHTATELAGAGGSIAGAVGGGGKGK